MKIYVSKHFSAYQSKLIKSMIRVLQVRYELTLKRLSVLPAEIEGLEGYAWADANKGSIWIDTHLTPVGLLEVIGHEMEHVHQWHTGKLQDHKKGFKFAGKVHRYESPDDYTAREYKKLAWEAPAYRTGNRVVKLLKGE